MKITAYLVASFLLLFVGYSVGLLVQHQQDVRTNATSQLYGEVRLHKQLSSGLYDQALRDSETQIRTYTPYVSWKFPLTEWPELIKASAFDESGADWRDGAFASVVGLHRARPDIAFPTEMKHQMEIFVPNDQSVQTSLDWYAQYKPAR